MSTLHAPGPVTVTTRRPGAPEPGPPFVDLEVMRNAYDMIAVISQRRSNGILTFAIFREFSRDGAVCRTNFVPEEMGEVYVDFAKVVLARMRELRDTGKLPFAVKAA